MEQVGFLDPGLLLRYCNLNFTLSIEFNSFSIEKEFINEKRKTIQQQEQEFVPKQRNKLQLMSSDEVNPQGIPPKTPSAETHKEAMKIVLSQSRIRCDGRNF